MGDKLKDRRTTGTAGGGMVEIEINGLLEVLRCRIDEQLISQGDRELIEDLVAAAIDPVDRRSSLGITSERMNPFCISVWMRPAACHAVHPRRRVQARTSFPPVVVKKVIKSSRR